MQIVSERFFDAFQAAVLKSSCSGFAPSHIDLFESRSFGLKKAQMPNLLPSNHEIQRQYNCCG
jgi:hypothetical protein